MNTDASSCTLRIKVNRARHLSGSWVLAVSGPGSSSTRGSRGGEDNMANSCLAVCCVYWLHHLLPSAIWIPRLVFYGSVIYAIVYFYSSSAFSPILFLTSRLWVFSFDIWLTLGLHCIFRYCLVLLCFWFNINQIYPKGKTRALNIKSMFTTKVWLISP